MTCSVPDPTAETPLPNSADGKGSRAEPADRSQGAVESQSIHTALQSEHKPAQSHSDLGTKRKRRENSARSLAQEGGVMPRPPAEGMAIY